MAFLQIKWVFAVKILLSNCSSLGELFDVIWVPPRGRNMSSVHWDAISVPLGKRIQKLYASSFCTEPCQDKWGSIHQLYGTWGDCQLGLCQTNSLCVSPAWTYLHCLAITKEMYYKSPVQRNYQTYILNIYKHPVAISSCRFNLATRLLHT